MDKEEFGIDENFDGHCDLCGRFVDRYGHHRARMVFDRDSAEQLDPSFLSLDDEVENMDTESFVDMYFSGRPYDSYRNGSYVYWPLIRKYTEDDTRDPYGRKAINEMLRFKGEIKNANPLDLIQIALKMNIAIDKFEVKKSFVTYRGMHFADRNNQFVEMLDVAYASLKKGEPFQFEDDGFVSTSRRMEYANRFSFGQNDCVQVLLAYVIQPGSKAMPLCVSMETTVKEYEKEVLLKFGGKYTVVGLERYRIDNQVIYKGIVLV